MGRNFLQVLLHWRSPKRISAKEMKIRPRTTFLMKQAHFLGLSPVHLHIHRSKRDGARDGCAWKILSREHGPGQAANVKQRLRRSLGLLLCCTSPLTEICKPAGNFTSCQIRNVTCDRKWKITGPTPIAYRYLVLVRMAVRRRGSVHR